MGIEVGDDFLQAATGFLNCRIGSTPFSFMGLQVGINHRKQESWKDVVRNMKCGLPVGSWLSIGGRVTLINVVLNSIPIYYLSFYRIPKVVLQKLVRIQWKFLWSGGLEKLWIDWVSWEDICRLKDKGGIGVRCLNNFNLALLAKWRWRLLVDRDALWRTILERRYGCLVTAVISCESSARNKKSSLWWRDIVE